MNFLFFPYKFSIFSKDIVLMDELRDDVNVKLERWYGALEPKGFKTRSTKTKHMNCSSSRDVVTPEKCNSCEN